MGDVMPTILDLYRVPPPERLDGKSLLPGRR
jgi:arylsulfatase A-like enzyme